MFPWARGCAAITDDCTLTLRDGAAKAYIDSDFADGEGHIEID